MPVLLPDEPIERLATQEPPQVMLSKEERDRVAHLAMALTQEAARRSGSIQPFVPYPERTEEQRAASRAAVTRVMQALIMLGHIER